MRHILFRFLLISMNLSTSRYLITKRLKSVYFIYLLLKEARKVINNLVLSKILTTFALAFNKSTGRSASSAGRAQHF